MSALDTWLRCPNCAGLLGRRGRTLVCPAGHSYDVARQGYVNLLGRAAPANADTPAMLDARARFQSAGHYAPIARAVAGETTGSSRILEAGAGTAYYLAAALDGAPSAEGLATDVSTAAARRAARAHPRAASVVADTWAGLPVVDGAADALLCVFAPRNAAEFGRALAPGGRLVVVVPTGAHLAVLRDRYGLLDVAGSKVDDVLAAFPGWPSRVEPVSWEMELTAGEVHDLIAMGPNAFHGPPADTAAATVGASVAVVTLTRPDARSRP